ncbi:preprotein translocase subunit SecE [candidate division WOR-1 bacterium RIFOXYB2_FULL_42_35]|uniref:Protein translocase subunit SecE n=1 Tax=candidate division WOR-1 bacterium RIFOXYC2_FULL_41_25 TaxID=1802586 RepID=A0A1F4TMI1_UNCSA|nr:MAG: preprotein translocase subunit SecE [candidate division WOR-1 bacterium RIFOXYA2_FULL_41_14]OGC23845.1 MAG: preprotein translocase subunit SecE [candidate division WOR-1 bacterium RIFOXYB2_FULL_42_35]OGC33720.1 MAG: preprotein translocase subunit SecE [candidate division WOR-1 bacterium RIFOXYC2_FULL_41_25]OGC42659.1 MAG: preprotein translocase subunit SecE [candidate division WOR-1 bacterium RIFOXYD2_FULL_41_8]
MKNIFEQLVKFIKETRAETRKVVWPDRRYVMVATVIILVLVFITGAYISLIDFIFSKVFRLLLR